MRSQLHKAGQPSVSSLEVEWKQYDNDAPPPVQAPRQPTALFSGSRLVVYGLVQYCTQVQRRMCNHINQFCTGTGWTLYKVYVVSESRMERVKYYNFYQYKVSSYIGVFTRLSRWEPGCESHHHRCTFVLQQGNLSTLLLSTQVYKWEPGRRWQIIRWSDYLSDLLLFSYEFLLFIIIIIIILLISSQFC